MTVMCHLQLWKGHMKFISNFLKRPLEIRRMKVFKPKEFTNSTSLFTLATISTSYWDLAEEFRKQALDQMNPTNGSIYSVYVFPAIIFYCSALEALINENLALLENQTSDNELRSEITQVKTSNGAFRAITTKLRRSHELFNHTGQAALEEDILQNYAALAELRNAIVHYCPEYVDILHWPERLKQAFQRSGVDPLAADWTITFRSGTVLEWARETTKSLIERFLPLVKIDHNHFFGN